jgi:hypothetical protein
LGCNGICYRLRGFNDNTGETREGCVEAAGSEGRDAMIPSNSEFDLHPTKPSLPRARVLVVDENG